MKYFLKVLYLFGFLAPFSMDVTAGIYKWVDAQGVAHYSDVKPEDEKIQEFIIKSYKKVSFEEAEVSKISKFQQATQANKKIPNKGNVVIYTTNSCGYCRQAKSYFKKMNIRYKEYNVDESSVARSRYKRLKATGVPVIFVGNKRMNGFSESGFDKIY
jgi:glutaredoxin